MENDKKIQILLSTYNGEQYLAEQLDSIVNLDKFKNIKVLIRDDGSTDSTINILNKYQVKYGFRIIYGHNIGVTASMYELFKISDPTCQYYAISDQDDVWLHDKITMAFKYMDINCNKEEPCLFATCSMISDENLSPIGKTTIPKRNLSFYNAMIQNVTPGHTQVFNRALLNKVLEKDISGILVIDWWLYLLASAIGSVGFNENYTVLHRQHGENAIGYELNPIKLMWQRIKRIRANQSYLVSQQLASFMNYYGHEMPIEFAHEIECFINNQKNIITRLLYVIKCKVYRQTVGETIFFKILYLFGRYKV